MEKSKDLHAVRAGLKERVKQLLDPEFQDFLEAWQLTDLEAQRLADPSNAELIDTLRRVYSRRAQSLLMALEEQPAYDDRKMVEVMRFWQALRLLNRDLQDLPQECRERLEVPKSDEADTDELY